MPKIRQLPKTKNNLMQSQPNCLNEEIVITGLSGRFPESHNIEEFKDQLFAGVDLVTDNERRWPSGINPQQIRGSKTGVFIGVSSTESDNFGVNLLLKPYYSLQFHRLGMLNSEGMCKSFDASGNGYVRSEAVVVVFLQKATDPKRIYATVEGTKTNTDGYKSQGVTYPSGTMQTQLMRELYDECGINPHQVSYVETHGSGTKVGDREEGNAIAEVFCQDRTTPLLIGSVKSNMGHTEPAPGLCSLAKVIIAMVNGMIPGNLYFKSPNPKIPALSDGRLQVIFHLHFHKRL